MINKLTLQNHHKMMMKDICLFPTIFNFFINGAIAIYLFHEKSSIPRYGSSGFVVDILITIFLTALMNATNGTKKIKKMMNNKTLKPIVKDKPIVKHQFLNQHPTFRSLLLALLFSTIVGFIICIGIYAFKIDTISFIAFIFIKGLIASFMAFSTIYVTTFISLHDINTVVKE